MSVLVAVPVISIGCKVGIEKGRAWSVIDEMLLWTMTREARTIARLAQEADLPRQVVAASIARMMRFRLVEVTLASDVAAFQASPFGFKMMTSGQALPYFPKRQPRRADFVIERVSGDFFLTRGVILASAPRLAEEAKQADLRIIQVESGGPSLSHEANMSRLAALVARGWDESIGLLDSRTATVNEHHHMLVPVIDGQPRGLPETAGETLLETVRKAARGRPRNRPFQVKYAGSEGLASPAMKTHDQCVFDPTDLVIGGSAQRRCLVDMLHAADRRMIVHSTFLKADNFGLLLDEVRAACARGVTIDLLWGAEKDEATEDKNALQAEKIAAIVRADPGLRGKLRVHLRSTGSHAKLLLVDTAEAGWIAAVGSCNWFSSPFQAVELTVVLRDQRLVADVAQAIQNMTGRRGLSDPIANEMYVLARDLRRPGATPEASAGSARIGLVIGEGHDAIMRKASGDANARMLIGSARLGATARPGALRPGRVAAAKKAMVTVLYSDPAGPVKKRHARAMQAEVEPDGVRLLETKKIPLHGKFVAWDDDDLVVTSLNWASASADDAFPWGDVGVHIQAPGVAENAIRRLEAIFPRIAQDPQPALDEAR